MPLLILILLVILIAQFGFWHMLQAIIGAAAMIVLFIVVAVALVAAVLRFVFKRLSGPP